MAAAILNHIFSLPRIAFHFIRATLLVKIVDNKNLLTAGFDEAKLLLDMEKVVDAKGFDILSTRLSYGNVNGLKANPNVLGFRWELQIGAYYQRLGNSIEFTQKLFRNSVGDISKIRGAGDELVTDIDVVVNGTTAVQAKTSVAIMQGTSTSATVNAGTVTKIEAWIEVAKEAGATEIRYVIPPGSELGKAATAAIKDKGGIIIDSIPF